MMRQATLLALFGLASACGGAHRPPPNDEITSRMTASDEAALDRGDRAPVTDMAAEIDRCVATFESATSGSAAADARAAAAACAELFERPGCRAAHRRAIDLPVESFVVTIFEACAREYCPLFPSGQRPSACDSADGHDAQGAAAAWRELRSAIWDLEGAAGQRGPVQAR